ncbi:unnamed protein product [Cuscuta europaea]|uniref:Uncharacterized protein n=1 Tax=Cuscuta europaea TaxID=41803 RepID=A0A9P1E6F1_CUSEU|nr:unnamed protein product [Cuscuta europaea]
MSAIPWSYICVVFAGAIMDVRNFAGLLKKSTKDQKKKETGTHNPVDEFFPRDDGPSDVPVDVAAAATERKAVGKGVAPIGKKPKEGETGKKAPPVLIVDEHSTSEPLVMATTVASNPPSRDFPQETVQFSLVKGTAVMHDTVEPKAFLRGITSEMDRAALGTYDDDDALKNKILRSSLTACVALGEQARRVGELRREKAQQDEHLRKLVHDNADAVRQMAKLEEDLRQAKAEAERAKGEKAEAEKVVVEEAEVVKAEAVAKAREDVVAAFLAEGWKAEGRKEWVASVVETSVDACVKGPGG